MTRLLVLFDIDGTLLLTPGAGRRAITAALADRMIDARIWEEIRFDGKTDPQIVREMLEAAGDASANDPQTVAEILERYLVLLEAELSRAPGRTRVLPGVSMLLDRLEAEADVVLGLLTGNIAPGAGLKLRSGGLDPARFRVGAYGSDSSHRPDLPAIAAERAAPIFGRVPAGETVIIVGDTPADVTCGRAIGARAVAVATGSYAVSELREAGARAAFEDLSDTDTVLEAILG
ncbi:MAG TPA: HAD hydrolase-like protein [Gemmatimonadales bacterium]|nr:HAD hydrolase-like protein [Gemmatimonadales bacterium]